MMGTPGFALLCYMLEEQPHYAVVKFSDIVAFSQTSSPKEDQCAYFNMKGNITLGQVIQTSDDEHELHALIRQKLESAQLDPVQQNTVAAHASSNLAKTVVYPMMSEDSNRNKMYILGPNGTAVSERLMSRIYWDDCITATCDLLHGVFGEAVTGPQELDPTRVQDVIFIVTKRCNVEERYVLRAIKRKCVLVRNQMSKRTLRDTDDDSDSELPRSKK